MYDCGGVCVKKILGDRLREYREKFHYTQIQVAIYSDITEKAYSNYELGKQMPRLDILMRIADVYGVSLDYLTGRTDKPSLNK